MHFRDKFKGQYTDKTISQHLRQEVHSVVDAYLNRNFKKLEILQQASDGRLYRRRHIKTEHVVFSAILYDYANKNETNLLQLREMAERAGAPGVLFSMDEPTLRKVVEKIHEQGWIRYETTHNLDQARLKEDFTALDFLKAYYQNENPVPSGDRKS